MTVWDKHPNYTEQELRLLVKAAASVLYDTADDQSQLEPEILELGPRSAARRLAREINATSDTDHLERLTALLGDDADARTACLTVLAEIRKHEPLAAEVAAAYEDQQNKMFGVEVLLVGALLVLAIRIKSVSVKPGVKVDFYESSDAVKSFIANLVTGGAGG
jgi:hypothetical protein